MMCNFRACNHQPVLYSE